MQAALNQVWPYVEEIFDTEIVTALPGIAADPAALRPAWTDYVENVIARSNIDRADPEMAVPRRPHRLSHREPGAPAARPCRICTVHTPERPGDHHPRPDRRRSHRRQH